MRVPYLRRSPSLSNPDTPRAEVISLPTRRHLAEAMDDEQLVREILNGNTRAKAIFFDRYGSYVRGILIRLLGHQVDIVDLLHDVFVSALSDLPKLRKPSSLKSWLTTLAVFRARRFLRTKRRRWWLQFFAPEDLPEETAILADEETRQALAAVYTLLERLPVDERIAFSLRFLAGMEIAEGAIAAGVSESTFKRRLKRAREVFEAEASNVSALSDWVEKDK